MFGNIKSQVEGSEKHKCDSATVYFSLLTGMETSKSNSMYDIKRYTELDQE